MKFSKYFKDNLFCVFIFLFVYILVLLMLFAFHTSRMLILGISFVLFVGSILAFIFNYFRKCHFYNSLFTNINNMDKAYLVLETLEKPDFYDGLLLYQALYDINKSMIENIRNYEEQNREFKEYIEMWIHEVKVPLASLILMQHNHKGDFYKKVGFQLQKIDDYVEQVLYYVRSENAYNDYFIKENFLDEMINCVALKNKDDMLENKIDFVVDNLHYKVFTDSKWFVFILNQIVNNSIKYKKDKGSSYIKISGYETLDTVVLEIIDNGIGIPASDIPKVFDKSFTGYNGRIRSKSTGMGLFIAKNLCFKLGHKIMIDSKSGEYTKVSIVFSKNKFYDVLK